MSLDPLEGLRVGRDAMRRVQTMLERMTLPADQRRAIADALGKVDQGEGVLVLTDMFGGTPSNIALSFLDERRVEVVTGMNLPMLIKLATLVEEKPLEELAVFIKGYGQRNISVASEILPDADA